MHERYRRQTDRRQTDWRRHIANVNLSSRSLKTRSVWCNLLGLGHYKNAHTSTWCCCCRDIATIFASPGGASWASLPTSFVVEPLSPCSIAMRKPSVRLYVKHMNCDKTKWRSGQIFIPYERTFILIFRHKEWLVRDDPWCLKFWTKLTSFEHIHRFSIDIHSWRLSRNT